MFKVVSNILLWLAGAACCAYSNGSYAMVTAGAFFIALFWQQNGWLAHDFLHHQVFGKRVYGDIMGLIIGNLWQGFSVEWWKDKHNTHHAIPNMHESELEKHDGEWTLLARAAMLSPYHRHRTASSHHATARALLPRTPLRVQATPTSTRCRCSPGPRPWPARL